MGCSRFLDDPKLEQCLNLGAYRVLFFSRVITLWESVLWQLSFRSVYLDDHRVHFRWSGTNRSVEDVDELSTKGPQTESWRVTHLAIWGLHSRDDRTGLLAIRYHRRPRARPVTLTSTGRSSSIRSLKNCGIKGFLRPAKVSGLIFKTLVPFLNAENARTGNNWLWLRLPTWVQCYR